MTVSEFLKDLVDSGKERIKTPLTSTYFIFFAIYNWRPIVLFIFSSKTIECKITFINENYCHSECFYIPLIYTFCYLILVPLISAGLEWLLFWPGSFRRENNNKEKRDIIEKDLELVEKQFELQDARSRNKEKEEMLKKISTLEDKNKNEKETHDVIARDLTQQVKDLTQRLRDATKREEKQLHANQTPTIKGINYRIMLQARQFSRAEINKLAQLPITEQVRIAKSELSGKAMRFMYEYGLIEETDTYVVLTDEGRAFIEFLREEYRPTQPFP